MANKNFVLSPGSAQVPPAPNITAANAPTLTTGQTVNTQTTPPQPVNKPQPIIKLVLSFVSSAVVYLIAWGVLNYYGVSPFFSILVGYILGLMTLAYVDSALESKLDMSKPVFILMTLILFVFLSINYLPEYSKNFSVSSSVVKRVSSETGNLRSVGDIWFTDEVFKPGKMIRIEITYNNVRMVGGEIFSPGVYNFPTIGTGCLMFEGVIDKPAQVKISY